MKRNTIYLLVAFMLLAVIQLPVYVGMIIYFKLTGTYLYLCILAATIMVVSLVTALILFYRRNNLSTSGYPASIVTSGTAGPLSEAVLPAHSLNSIPSPSMSGQPSLPVTYNRKKNRLVARKGLENIALRLEDIILFYTEQKIVYVVDSQGKKYLSDKTLGELEDSLDPELFFRANRQYLINIDYVRGFKSYEKVKLQVVLSVTIPEYAIIISQETAPAFRKWVNQC